MSLLLLECHILLLKIVAGIEGLPHQGEMNHKAFSEVLPLVTGLFRQIIVTLSI